MNACPIGAPDVMTSNQCAYCGRDDGHNEVCITVELERWKENYKTLLDDCIQRRTEIERLRANVGDACEFLRRGAALVAMAGDQSMALSMHRHAERILAGSPVETTPNLNPNDKCGAAILQLGAILSHMPSKNARWALEYAITALQSQLKARGDQP